MTVRQALSIAGILRALAFLMLLNLAFGALVKAWLRGTIQSYNMIGLGFLIIPMAIVYWLLLTPLWQAKHGEPIEAKKELALYCALLLTVLCFIGGFYIDVSF